MKVFIVFAALLALFSTAYSGTLNDKLECLRLSKEAKIGESTIRGILEDLRTKLTKYDPMNVTDKHTVINNDFISLDSIYTAQSEGLSGFEIKKLSFSLIGLKFNLQLVWEKVFGRGSYNINLNSTLFPTNIVGEGDFDVLAQNFVFNAKGKLSLSIIGLNIQIKYITVEMTLEDFALQISGLMHDNEFSANLSNYLTENMSQMLIDYKDKINQILDDQLDVINKILAGKQYFSGPEMSRLTAYLIACGEYD